MYIFYYNNSEDLWSLRLTGEMLTKGIERNFDEYKILM